MLRTEEIEMMRDLNQLTRAAKEQVRQQREIMKKLDQLELTLDSMIKCICERIQKV